MEAQSPKPHTVEEVFNDFRGRRAGLLKALSVDVEKFFHQCDPSKENLFLCGLPNGTWEVKTPDEEIPPELPEPVLGINFARDGMLREEWIALIAVHSDAWLLSVAFFFGGRFGFGRKERERLFQMINRLATISEIVIGNANQPMDRSAIQNSEQSKSSGGKPRHSVSHTKASNISPPLREEDEEEDDEEGGVCGVCEESGGEQDEFWILCDTCEIWFHGRCVKITPAEAVNIKDYKCRSCSKNKKIKA